MKKLKSTLMICIIILIPILPNLNKGNHHRHIQFLKIPQEKWLEITHQKNKKITQWQRLDDKTWILNPPNNSFSMQVDFKKIQNILDNFGPKIALECVLQNPLSDQELEPFGLSSTLQTQIRFKNNQKTFQITLGNLTPNREEIYVLHKNNVYKSALTFLIFR